MPQTAWIMNATLRDNVLFGREENEGRFRDIIEACSLVHDLEMLPNGEMTEIGEKGINLRCGNFSKPGKRFLNVCYSGGQKVTNAMRGRAHFLIQNFL